MRIDLDETYSIEWDGMSFQLLEKKVVTGEGPGANKVKKENIGQVRERCLGYYSNLSHALSGYIKQDIAKESIETMEALMDYFDTFYERLDAVFKPIGYDIKKRYAEQQQREVPAQPTAPEGAPETETQKAEGAT